MLILIILFYPLLVSACMLIADDFQDSQFSSRMNLALNPSLKFHKDAQKKEAPTINNRDSYCLPPPIDVDKSLFESEDPEMVFIYKKAFENSVSELIKNLPDLDLFKTPADILDNMALANLNECTPHQAFVLLRDSINLAIESNQNIVNCDAKFEKFKCGMCEQLDNKYKIYHFLITIFLEFKLFQVTLFRKFIDGKTLLDKVGQNMKIAPELYNLLYNFEFCPEIISHPTAQEVLSNFKKYYLDSKR